MNNFVKPDSFVCGSTDSTFRNVKKLLSYCIHRVLHFRSFPVNFSNEKISTILSNLLSIPTTRYLTLKFHYLKLGVTSDAALLINNLQISNDNYTSAWKRISGVLEEY